MDDFRESIIYMQRFFTKNEDDDLLVDSNDGSLWRYATQEDESAVLSKSLESVIVCDKDFATRRVVKIKVEE